MIKDVWILVYCCSFILVNAHPVTQSIHPGVNYQQNAYRSPHSEAFILQPSYNNPYSQHVLVQTPPSSYQSVQVPSLLEQISQIYWDKLLSDPSVRSLVYPNNIIYDQYGKDFKNNIQPCTGGVVNNYLILPPEYFKGNEYNETVSKSLKTKGVKNHSKGRKKARKKKVSNEECIKSQNVESLNVKKEKVKQNEERAWNFISDNIKCFTPADILNNEKYNPVEKYVNINEDKNRCKANENKTPKSTREIDNENNCKPRKINKNKCHKQAKNDQNNKIKEKVVEKVSSSTKMPKKPNQRKKVLDLCDCIDNDDVPNSKCKVTENIPECCRQDINDDLYTKLLQQSCTDLENRRTRNSKSNAPNKDFRNVYDFSDDVTKSMNWYLSDIFSPQSFQKGSSTNFMLGNNMYPFDLSQLYQNPQYSNKDINQSNRNAGKNKNNKQKKKKKKKNSKIPKENSTNIDDSDNSTFDTSIQLLESSTQTPGINNDTRHRNAETITQESETKINLAELIAQIAETNPQILDKVAKIVENIKNIERSSKRPDTIIDVPVEYAKKTVENDDVNEMIRKETMLNVSEKWASENSPNDTNITLTTEEVATYTINVESTTRSVNNFDHVTDPTINEEELRSPDTRNQSESIVNLENQEDKLTSTKEMFETQIPESVHDLKSYEHEIHELKSTNPKIEGETNNHIPSTTDFQVMDEISESEPEDEFLRIYDNRLMYDYYPDFTADNHAYLVSEEEIDFRDVHDRYFYTSDRNINSREDTATNERSQIFSEKIVFSKDELDNKKSIDAKVSKENDKSQEIIFKTPPVLESPDFITRKINRDRQDSAEIYYQPQYYEDHIDRFNLDNFADRSDHVIQIADGHLSNENKTGSFVETVYARSKVVKYGQGQETNKHLKPEVKKNFQLLKDVGLQNDDEKTIIIAKSLPLGDFW